MRFILCKYHIESQHISNNTELTNCSVVCSECWWSNLVWLVRSVFSVQCSVVTVQVSVLCLGLAKPRPVLPCQCSCVARANQIWPLTSQEKNFWRNKGQYRAEVADSHLREGEAWWLRGRTLESTGMVLTRSSPATTSSPGTPRGLSRSGWRSKISAQNNWKQNCYIMFDWFLILIIL